MTKPTWPAGGALGAKLALSLDSGAVSRTPRQFGPTSRMPASRQTPSSSRSSWAPFLPVSAKPADSTSTPRTPFSAHSPATSTTASAGTAITARSTSAGTAAMLGKAGTPCTVSAAGLTG